jgi:hypothetical protein
MSGRSAAIVLDASVILKWVLDAETEPGHAAANRLLERWLHARSTIAGSTWVARRPGR